MLFMAVVCVCEISHSLCYLWLLCVFVRSRSAVDLVDLLVDLVDEKDLVDDELVTLTKLGMFSSKGEPFSCCALDDKLGITQMVLRMVDEGMLDVIGILFGCWLTDVL
jgi:hypothetical protein